MEKLIHISTIQSLADNDSCILLFRLVDYSLTIFMHILDEGVIIRFIHNEDREENGGRLAKNRS